MKKIQVVLGFVISGFFLYLIIRNINIDDLFSALSSINYYLLLPAVIIQLGSYWVRSIRWSLILRSIKKVKTNTLFPIICISYMANNILPLRIGEIIRAYLMGKKENISSAAVFSTVIVERIYDGITLLLYLGVVSVLFPFPDWVKNIGLITTLLFLASLLFIIAIVIYKNTAISMVNFFLRFVPSKFHDKINAVINKLIDGFEVIKDKKMLLPIAMYSIIIWLMEAYLFFALAKAFNFDNSIYIALFTLVVVNLGIMIPSSPGYVGTFEYFCSKSLGVFKISNEVALGFALILRVAQYIPITLLGFFFLFKEGISLSQFYKRNQGGS
jgi:uncharacterized protein (TIRG00374 family)